MGSPCPTRLAPLSVVLAVLLLVAACTPGSDTGAANDPQAGAPGAATDPQAGDPQAGAPEVLHLRLHEAVLADLYQRDPNSDDRVEARLFRGLDGDEELALDGGIRFRGSSSRFHPKKSFNVRLAEGRDFLYGSNRMNLKAMYTDATLMRESLTMAMWHELGQPAPRTRHVDLYINGVYEGLYVHVERVDGDLLEANGLDPGGTLVRDGFRDGFDLPRSAFGIDQASAIELRSLVAENFDSRNDPDWNALAELVAWAAVVEAGPAFAADFEQRFDVDNVVDWLALNTLIGDVDSFGDDYWLYLDHEDPDARWMVIPWDNDLSLGAHSRADGDRNDYITYRQDITVAAAWWQNGLVQKILATPPLRTALEERVLELMTDPFDREWFEERIERTRKQIEPSLTTTRGPGRFALHPRQHDTGPGRFDEHLEVILDYVDLRWAYLTQTLTGAPSEGRHALDPGERPDVLVFRDDEANTVARVSPRSIEGAGEISIGLQPFDGPPGIDRAWQVTVTGATVEGAIELFYRNDVGHPSVGIPAENWFVSDHATAGQDDLQLVRVGPDGSMTLVQSRVNPFSNKVVADLTLVDGTTVLALVLRDHLPAPAGT
jgi:spore coat protein H